MVKGNKSVKEIVNELRKENEIDIVQVIDDDSNVHTYKMADFVYESINYCYARDFWFTKATRNSLRYLIIERV